MFATGATTSCMVIIWLQLHTH